MIHPIENYEGVEREEESWRLEDKKYELKIEKRSERFKWIFFIFVIMLMFVASDFIRVFYHENVHAAIFDTYGVSYIKGYDFGDWKTGVITFYVQANGTEYAQRCDATCKALQIENETFSYNTSTIFYTLWVIFAIYLFKCFLFDD